MKLYQITNVQSLWSILRERLGHHIHGEIWATNIKSFENGLLDRPIHVISANMHSVMNSIFCWF
jgi:hypothetical protein